MKRTLFLMLVCLLVLVLSGLGLAQMRGYGMERGMMGCYGLGPGMMGPGSYNYSPECQKFYDDTLSLRKKLYDKEFEYFEVIRNPKSTGKMATKLQNEIDDIEQQLYETAPLGCTW